jgi:hypothetical protein
MDFGGHQNAQFADAISTMETPNVNAIKILILDAYPHTPNYIVKMHKEYDEYISFERFFVSIIP